MPSVIRVKDWYTQSFQDLMEFPGPEKYGMKRDAIDGGRGVRYFIPDGSGDVPPEAADYNKEFVKCIENIKKRHDPTTTTI
ncbi:hypothetical protein HK104_010580, partial [Borealophlyctis nickersoniae]